MQSEDTVKFTLLGTSRKGRLTVVHVTATAVDDVEGYARHARDFADFVVLPGHIVPVTCDEDDAPTVEQVDMTAPDFAF